MSCVPAGSRITGRGTALISYIYFSLRLTCDFRGHYGHRGLNIHGISHCLLVSKQFFGIWNATVCLQGSSCACMHAVPLRTFMINKCLLLNGVSSLRLYDIIIYIHVLTEL